MCVHVCVGGRESRGCFPSHSLLLASADGTDDRTHKHGRTCEGVEGCCDSTEQRHTHEEDLGLVQPEEGEGGAIAPEASVAAPNTAAKQRRGGLDAQLAPITDCSVPLDAPTGEIPILHVDHLSQSTSGLAISPARARPAAKSDGEPSFCQAVERLGWNKANTNNENAAAIF